MRTRAATDRAAGKHYTGTFRYSTYVSAGHVASFAGALDDAVAWCKATQVERVFLEVYRGGAMATEEDLRACRDALRATGIHPSGGLTTTCMSKRSSLRAAKQTVYGTPASPNTTRFCLSAENTAEHFEHCARLAGRLFDELILDDFYFTDCRCAECEAARGGRSWAQLRMDQFVAVSRRLLDAAHGVNPRCKVIVKYPQWYDRFAIRGYDVVRETEMFDGIWVGTETRDPRPGKAYNFVKESQSWIVYNWLHDIGRRKTWGGWFDPYGCDEPSYVEQGYQNVLIGTPEILLFCYPSLRGRNEEKLVEALRRHTPRLRRWSAALAGAAPIGIACYKPPHSEPQIDAYLLDYLVMIGLPVTLHATFPAEAKMVFLSEAALTDEAIADKLQSYLRSGGRVVATATFVRGLDKAAAREVFGLEPAGAEPAMRATTSIRWAGRDIPLDTPMVLTGNLRVDSAEVLAAAGDDAKAKPFLTRFACGEGEALMLDVAGAWMEADGGNVKSEPPLLFLPQAVLDPLRDVVLAPLGLSVEAPASVGIYCFPPQALAVCNYRDELAQVRIRRVGEGMFGSLADLAGEAEAEGRVVRHDADGIELELPPRSRILLSVRRA